MREQRTRPLARYRWAFEHLRAVLKPAIAFEIWSTLIFVVSLGPASGWLLNRLIARSGQYAIADQDIVAFFLSPLGILFLLLNVGFVLAFWFAEQAGLLIIIVNAVRKRQISVSLALWQHITYIPALFRLGVLQGVVYLVAGIPVGVGIWLTYRLLLREFDFYFYLNVRPGSWWVAVAVAGTLVTAYLVLAAWLYIRWLFSVPAVVFENATPTGALRQSWRQTRGRFRAFAFPLAVCWLVVLMSSLAMTWLIKAVAAQILGQIGLTLSAVVPTVIATLALVAIVDLAWFMIGKIFHVMLMSSSYLETIEGESEPREPAPATTRISPKGLKRLGWLVAGVVLIMGIAGGAAFLERLNIDRSIAITAHRGSKLKAPENTLSALRGAIADGADYAELDVQTTADGVVVLLHDADLMRVASVNRRIDELRYDELRDIDVGSWFDPEFSSERIATLQEAIDVARGHIKLNIELKYNRDDPALAEEVGRLIRENGFVSECVVSSLKFDALAEIEQVVPELTTGFIVFHALGDLSTVETDFLSVNAARATPRLVRELHRRGREIHVWTVTDPSNALAMIEVGVDNIITDDSKAIRSLLEEWNELSDSEKLALALRNLILRFERPEPAEL